MDETGDQNAKRNRTDLQTTVYRQDSTTSSVFTYDKSSVESVLTKPKNDNQRAGGLNPNANQNSAYLQTRLSRENSNTSSSILSASDDKSSLESVLTDPKNDNARNQQEDQSTVSPPVQYQSPRVSGYDPNRIPPSVFGRPGTPGEWSVASNESLFSIHVGNFSCTSLSTPMFRSGDLSKLVSDLQETPRGNDAVPDSHSTTGNRAMDSKTRNHLSTQSFQFPVLAGSRDGWMSSPKMVEAKKHQTLHTPQPLMNMFQRRENSQKFESKSKKYNNSSIISRFFCFSYCCTPSRGNED